MDAATRGWIVVTVGVVCHITAWRGAGLRRGGSCAAITVTIRVDEEGDLHAFIYLAVAIIVKAIADFRLRQHLTDAIPPNPICTNRNPRSANTNPIRSNRAGIADLGNPIYGAIAIVVNAIASLGGAGVNICTIRGRIVVAVGVIRHITHGRRACLHGYGGVAVSIAVGIGIPSGSARHTWIGIIYQTVAVVVEAVADFGGAGVDGCIGVVAVIRNSKPVLIHVSSAATGTVGTEGCKVAATGQAGIVRKIVGDWAEAGESGGETSSELIILEVNFQQTTQIAQ